MCNQTMHHQPQVIVPISVIKAMLKHFKPFFLSFPIVPPPPHQCVLRPLVMEHVSLHSKSLCKNMERASGGANNKKLTDEAVFSFTIQF